MDAIDNRWMPLTTDELIDGFFYLRVRLNKRRTRVKSAMNSKLIVKHRNMTEDEVFAQVSEYNTLFNSQTVTFS